MEVQGIQQKVILLNKIKKFCYLILPLFFGFSLLQIVCNTSTPLAVARGQSMQPNVREGDILLFQGVPPDEIQVGDIIFFEVPVDMRDILPERITHRVIEVNYDSNGIFFRTQGDNAPPDTYEVRSSDVLGKKIAIINGHMIKEGVTAGRLTVVRITKKIAVLKIDDVEYEVELKE